MGEKLEWEEEKSLQGAMGVALLSQAKKSECGISQPKPFLNHYLLLLLSLPLSLLMPTRCSVGKSVRRTVVL